MQLLAKRQASIQNLDCLPKKNSEAKRRSAIVQKKRNKFWMFLYLAKNKK